MNGEMIWLTVFHPIFEHQFCTFLARFPPWGHAASRRLPTELGEILVCLIQDSMLLLDRHGHRIFMRVAMKSSTIVPLQYGESLCNRTWRSYISCPASLTMVHSSGNVSRECPGIKKVVLMSYLAKSFRSLRTPTVPAKRPTSR